MLARISSLEPVVPYKNLVSESEITPFKTNVKSLFCSSVISPKINVLVVSVVPSKYCQPESIRNIPFSCNS